MNLLLIDVNLLLIIAGIVGGISSIGWFCLWKPKKLEDYLGVLFLSAMTGMGLFYL